MDGRGVPLSLVVTGANRHDVTQLKLVLDEIVIDAPDKKKVTQHLCADTGYSGEAAGLAMEARGYHPHVKQWGEEIQEKKNNPGCRARRWVAQARHAFQSLQKAACAIRKASRLVSCSSAPGRCDYRF